MAGARRRGTAAAVALVCAWSGAWLAVWLLVADALSGALLSAIDSSISATLVGSNGSSPGGAALSVAGGALRGAVAGLVSSLVTLVVDEPLQFLGALCGGLLVSLALLVACVGLEPWLLRLRGFRRLSRREASRVMPLLEVEAADLGLVSLPLVLMADGDDLRVRACARHLVIGRSLLGDEIGDGPAGDAVLDAVLCHGLHHWAAGDGVGDLLVRCCGLPLVVLYNAGYRLTQQGNGLIALVGWVVLWPAWLLVRLIIRPIVAVASRDQEFATDAAVAATGRGEALHGALSLLGSWNRASRAGIGSSRAPIRRSSCAWRRWSHRRRAAPQPERAADPSSPRVMRGQPPPRVFQAGGGVRRVASARGDRDGRGASGELHSRVPPGARAGDRHRCIPHCRPRATHARAPG